MRQISTLILHCSASQFGDAQLIRSWHLDRGFRDIGYHYVILNCYPGASHWNSKRPDPRSDGLIQAGRPLDKIGAHARGFNRDSVGVCLAGDKSFTGRQLESLKRLYRDLLKINPRLLVQGHYELDERKTCPNMDMDEVRQFLNDK